MKKHVFQIAIIVLFLGFNLTSTAQENFLTATIINNNGDKLRGFIDYGNWDKSPDKIAFRKKEASEIIYFYPKDIKTFQVANKVYISGIVDVWAENSKIIIDSIFLQTLFKGEKSLYQYRSKEGLDHFYIGSDRDIILLLSKKPTEKKDTYEKQLLANFNDCSSIKKDIKTAGYNSPDLIVVFQKYLACANENYAFVKDVEKKTIELGPVLGVTRTKIGFTTNTINNSAVEGLVNTDFPPSTNPTFGIFLNAKISRNLGTLSVHNELLFATYRTSATYLDIRNEDYIVNSSWDLGIGQAKLNTMLRYRYRVSNSFVFVNGGLSFALNVNEVNSLVQEITQYDTNRTVETEAIVGIENTEMGYFLGFGAQKKSLSLEARFELSAQGIANLTYLNSSIFRAHFLISYKIR